MIQNLNQRDVQIKNLVEYLVSKRTVWGTGGRQKNKLTELPSKWCRQPGGGRKAQAPDVEEALTTLDWGAKDSHARTSI